MKVCEVCGKTSYEVKIYNPVRFDKFLCQRHYDQMRCNGRILERTMYDPNIFIVHDGYAEVVLHNRQGEESGRALIDIEDIEHCKQKKWHFDARGYVFTKPSKHALGMHRFIMNPKNDEYIDHINGIKYDNRRSNLRVCTNSQNLMNRGLQGNNKSGVTGVYWRPEKNKWQAQIKVNGVNKYLGIFKTIEEAKKVRTEAEKELFGEFQFKKELT